MVPVVRIVPPLLVKFPNALLTYVCLTFLRAGNDPGAIYALASFFAFAAPRAKFLLFFVVPMPAWACIGAIACFDVYNAFTRRVRHFLLLAAFAQTLHTVLYLR
jgi:membrane associated rhomboid family serine protease